MQRTIKQLAEEAGQYEEDEINHINMSDSGNIDIHQLSVNNTAFITSTRKIENIVDSSNSSGVVSKNYIDTLVSGSTYMSESGNDLELTTLTNASGDYFRIQNSDTNEMLSLRNDGSSCIIGDLAYDSPGNTNLYIKSGTNRQSNLYFREHDGDGANIAYDGVNERLYIGGFYSENVYNAFYINCQNGNVHMESNLNIPSTSNVDFDNKMQISHNGVNGSILNTSGTLIIENDDVDDNIDVVLGDSGGASNFRVINTNGRELMKISSARTEYIFSGPDDPSSGGNLDAYWTAGSTRTSTQWLLERDGSPAGAKTGMYIRYDGNATNTGRLGTSLDNVETDCLVLDQSNGNVRCLNSMNVGADSDANGDAILELTSTSKGVLFPRLTTSQRDAISTPAAGLELFNTTLSQMQYYDGSEWVGEGMLMGEIYYDNNATATTITTQSTWTKVHGNPSDGEGSAWGLSGAQYAELKYTGSISHIAHMGITFSYISAANNDTFIFGVVKNGTFNASRELTAGTVIPQSKIRMTSKSNTEYNSTAIHWMNTPATNDIYYLVVQNTSGTGNLTVSEMNFFAVI